MNFLGGILTAILKALLDFFRQSRSDAAVRQQTEDLAREAQNARDNLIVEKEKSDVVAQAAKTADAVRDLSNHDLIERLRSAQRKTTST